MKFFALLSVCISILAAHAGAQTVLDPFKAKEALTQTAAKATTDLGADASLRMVAFFASNQSGIGISMDPATGKASMWTYFYYSPTSKKIGLYIATKVPLFGFLIQAIPADSLGTFPVDQIPALGTGWVDSDVALQGAQAGGGTAFFQAHADAMINSSVAIYNPIQIPSPPVPPGPVWRFEFASAADTLECIVNGTTGVSIFCGTLTSVPPLAGAAAFGLDQNYPNPAGLASGKTTIGFRLSEEALRGAANRDVTLTLFDALGRDVRVLAGGAYDPGSYWVHVDVSALPAGLYIYRLQTPAGSLARRLLVTH